MTEGKSVSASAAPGPPHDWSGSWVRATRPAPSGAERPDVVATFVSGHGGLTFAFQPIVDTSRAPAGVHAVECLVRGPAGTPHEEPAQFFEFFRCRGELATVDSYCLEAALAEAATLPFAGHLVVNVEAVSVASPEFEARLLGLARRSGIDPSRLILDVRLGYEEAPMGRLASGVVRTRSAGVRVCFEEARASASPVLLLEVATPDFLKLSRSTVRNLWRDPWTRQCVEATLGFGERLGFEVIAQGVESDRDLAAVNRCGIALVQGHLVGPPRSADALRLQCGPFDLANLTAGPDHGLEDTACRSGEEGSHE